MAWRFDACERLLEGALEEWRKHEDEPPGRRTSTRARGRPTVGAARTTPPRLKAERFDAAYRYGSPRPGAYPSTNRPPVQR